MQFFFKKTYIFIICFICFKCDSTYSQITRASAHLPRIKEQGFTDNEPGIPFVNLKIKEVKDTIQYANLDAVNMFQYQGTVEGAITHLLQNHWSHSTPHIRFLNKPSKKRYVYLHGTGLSMSSTKFKDEKENNIGEKIAQGFGGTPSSNAAYVEGREIAMSVLKHKFKFEVTTIMDSLDVVSLTVIDSHRMNPFIIPWERAGYHCNLNKDESVHKKGLCIEAAMFIWGIQLESMWNIYVEDETNTRPTHFFFKFPTHLVESFQKIEEFDAFVRANYGFALTKRKELRPVYCIKFL